jgi:hypothetical protein
MGVTVVRYGGYTMDVPAGWPVYRLDTDPARCVRYDRHAVYLGQPGADQQCPAHLAGRVGTISLAAGAPGTPAGPASPPPAGPQWQPAVGLSPGPTRLGGQVLQNQQEHQFWGSFAHPGLTVSATYGNDAGLVGQIIATLRPSGPAAPSGQVHPSGPVASARPAPMARTMAFRKRAGTVFPSVPRTGFGPAGQLGFDACNAPSVATMRIWRQAYSAIAIYIGGPEAACGLGNLSAAWVRAVTAMGWSLIPTYVGAQARCTTFSDRIPTGRAMPSGRAAADDAIGLAVSLGIGRGAPIYDDMEFYNSRNHGCAQQVLSFLNGWTRELHARGYRSGVYSSASAAVQDLASNTRIYRWQLIKPDTIWFALWDGQANLDGWPYLRPWLWTGQHRVKQYQGGHNRQVGGITINIDSDYVAGDVYR